MCQKSVKIKSNRNVTLILNSSVVNMSEITGDKRTFEERVEAHMERLRGSSADAVFNLANTIPGGPCDAPFAPIDPALYAAARRIVDGNHLNNSMRNYGIQRGMLGV